MKINILNKQNFDKLMAKQGINENVDTKNICVISITNTDGDTSYFENINSPNVLKLKFDDVDKDVSPESVNSDHTKPMNEDQGKEIISFLTKVKENMDNYTTLFIHCKAGQNRSGSVGKFAADFLGYEQDKLMKDNPQIQGNGTVSRILNRLWLWSHYAD